MLRKHANIRIGLRTIKTAAAVMVAMLVVDTYGATTSKLILAMLGAMDAVQPTFKESLRACLTQVVGVFFGALVGVVLLMLPLNHLLCAGIGVVAVITLYNTLHIRFSPGLPCLILVTLCTTADIQPLTYALGRIWDSCIGLSVGMVINTLIFPYDNSHKIRASVHTLDREVIQFLEEVFDGDDVMPDVAAMTQTVGLMAKQMEIFSNQWLLMHLNRQKQELESFAICEQKARELLARMVILSHIPIPGRLNDENRRRLERCGAQIRDQRPLDAVQEKDVVTNYHVAQILKLRRELLEALGRNV